MKCYFCKEPVPPETLSRTWGYCRNCPVEVKNCSYNPSTIDWVRFCVSVNDIEYNLEFDPDTNDIFIMQPSADLDGWELLTVMNRPCNLNPYNASQFVSKVLNLKFFL